MKKILSLLGIMTFVFVGVAEAKKGRHISIPSVPTTSIPASSTPTSTAAEPRTAGVRMAKPRQ